MNHLMIDLINVNKEPSSPLCAIDAVFFEPSTGQIGKVFYSSIDIRKSESLKGRISISTAFDWMKKDSHWRAEVMSATEAEEDALCSLAAFIADNTCPRNAALFVWFKDAPEKLVSLRNAVDRLEVSGIFPEGTKYRCIRSLLDLAAATDYAPHARSALARYTLTDARYQAEQVCEIWQRLTSPHIGAL
ncbi:3'-5' exoribonuclease [Klebsiella pneumoniae]|nr:3'-5' exoribonuclease [Klebsiella pneumoniae]MCJ1876300.1 3'-5' exoribonuclease [Klebsiella sp. HSTU-Sny5]TFB66525.1 3'-5' exoribonuclease [Klebsiella pneumoniae subsp. pneumoniae]SVZ39580.1 exodeoxyribonuclease VIII [Klebsiella pneumoniae]SVZ45559.1 exodeoxyribonuclease VIII [Klebsiella pneumoniae]